jgi:hypothetical protein
MIYTAGGKAIECFHNGTSVGTSYTHSHVSGSWHHIMTVWDGTTLKLYIDGTERMSIARTGALGSRTQFSIGSYSTNTFSRGDMAAAHCGWWVNVALTPAQVYTLYSGLPEGTFSPATIGTSMNLGKALTPPRLRHRTGGVFTGTTVQHKKTGVFAAAQIRHRSGGVFQ